MLRIFLNRIKALYYKIIKFLNQQSKLLPWEIRYTQEKQIKPKASTKKQQI